jgi:CBS domain-containing protein
MLVKDAMVKKVVVTEPTATVKDIAKTMTRHRIGSLLVVEKGELIGIVTELDIIWKVVAGDLDPNTTLVNDIMTKKVVAITSDKTLEDATHVMVEKKIKKLPVLEGKKLVGLITATDVISVQPKLIEALAKLLLFEEKKAVAG